MVTWMKGSIMENGACWKQYCTWALQVAKDVLFSITCTWPFIQGTEHNFFIKVIEPVEPYNRGRSMVKREESAYNMLN